MTYFARELSSPVTTSWADYCGQMVSQWMAERCLTGLAAAGCREETTRLYVDFCAWCDRNGVSAPTLASFGRALRAKGLNLSKGSTGRKMRFPVQLKPVIVQ